MRQATRSRFLVFSALLATGITLTGADPAFAGGKPSVRTGNFKASAMAGKDFLSRRFRRPPFVGVAVRDGTADDRVIIIQQIRQFHFPPTVAPAEPAERKVYVQPRWVDGGHGVEILQPGYWTFSKPRQ
ncbi:MAG TPA: hypothetical protein VNO43_15795 [Candidatus Eisenbacteria bacterium]|nr:hypothetical protein [Candidatus Eisenbacteria bacterium]